MSSFWTYDTFDLKNLPFLSLRKMKESVSIIVVGFGNRGEVYASYSLKHPDRARVIGFADPRAHVTKKYLEIYHSTVDRSLVFADWQEFIKLGKKVADCVLITLPDKLHKQAAIDFTRLGYHMLVEKPMATLLDDCRQITVTSRQHPNQINAVCHVMRYYGPCIKIKQLIESGVIGDVVNISHTEPVGFWHFAHSFVRGNWHREGDSSFSLLAKCCHDIDLIVYWMGPKKRCLKVSSFGSLKHFRKENAPSNSTSNCLSCPAEPECCYSAKKLYLKPTQKTNNWPSSVVLSAEINNVLTKSISDADIEDLFTDKTSESDRRQLLEKCLAHPNTNYGRCVYHMDNDVCDNQIVIMQFDDGSTASMTMIANSKETCARKTRVYGTSGQLDWDDSRDDHTIEHYDFLSGKTRLIDVSDAAPSIKKPQNPENINNSNIKLTGHGGSDYYLMDAFVEAILRNDKSLVLTDLEDSFRSHLVVFAAEHSRLTNSVVDFTQFCQQNETLLI